LKPASFNHQQWLSGCGPRVGASRNYHRKIRRLAGNETQETVSGFTHALRSQSDKYFESRNEFDRQNKNKI
jgi:hypothetical protein